MPFELPDWARAHGGPVFAGAFRETPEDFIVDEVLDVDFTGDGEHDWLLVEKRGSNTDWIGRSLARHAGVRPADVGYSGLKDRHAVTTQWFSVLRKPGGDTDWGTWSADGARVLRRERHARKLRRGTHTSNRFRITVRHDPVDGLAERLADRVARIRELGVPNYFGEQRFGRDAGNIALAIELLEGRRMKRQLRGIAISAGRSYVFNAILDARVRNGSWDRIVAGERANLDGSGSVFDVGELTADLERRAAEHDIHPTATLWGRDAPLGSGEAARFETDIARGFDASAKAIAAGLERSTVAADSRATRLVVHEFENEAGRDAVRFAFRLDRGGYATAVLREIVSVP